MYNILIFFMYFNSFCSDINQHTQCQKTFWKAGKEARYQLTALKWWIVTLGMSNERISLQGTFSASFSQWKQRDKFPKTVHTIKIYRINLNWDFNVCCTGHFFECLSSILPCTSCILHTFCMVFCRRAGLHRYVMWNSSMSWMFHTCKGFITSLDFTFWHTLRFQSLLPFIIGYPGRAVNIHICGLLLRILNWCTRRPFRLTHFSLQYAARF